MLAMQEIRRVEVCSQQSASRNLYILYGNLHLETGFFVYGEISAPTKDKSDDTKGSFYEEQERVSDQFPNHTVTAVWSRRLTEKFTISWLLIRKLRLKLFIFWQ
jgi:hypothetical protein